MSPSTGTADDFFDTEIGTNSLWRSSSTHQINRNKRYNEMWSKERNFIQPPISIENLITIPNTRKPEWASDILQGIQNSIIPSKGIENDGRWLSQEVANAASDFYSETADLLPCKPFIYSSRKGDLVSEFNTGNGALSIIISPIFTMLFTVIDGEPEEKIITHPREIRKSVEEFTKTLFTG